MNTEATKLDLNKSIQHLQQEKKILYLTFDDGPTPDVTEKVLELLGKPKK